MEKKGKKRKYQRQSDCGLWSLLISHYQKQTKLATKKEFASSVKIKVVYVKTKYI